MIENRRLIPARALYESEARTLPSGRNFTRMRCRVCKFYWDTNHPPEFPNLDEEEAHDGGCPVAPPPPIPPDDDIDKLLAADLATVVTFDEMKRRMAADLRQFAGIAEDSALKIEAGDVDEGFYFAKEILASARENLFLRFSALNEAKGRGCALADLFGHPEPEAAVEPDDRLFAAPSPEEAAKIVSEWNAAHAVGTPIFYFGIIDREDTKKRGKTRSAAWVLPGNNPVVSFVSDEGEVILACSLRAVKVIA